MEIPGFSICSEPFPALVTRLYPSLSTIRQADNLPTLIRFQAVHLQPIYPLGLKLVLWLQGSQTIPVEQADFYLIHITKVTGQFAV